MKQRGQRRKRSMWLWISPSKIEQQKRVLPVETKVLWSLTYNCALWLCSLKCIEIQLTQRWGQRKVSSCVRQRTRQEPWGMAEQFLSKFGAEGTREGEDNAYLHEVAPKQKKALASVRMWKRRARSLRCKIWRWGVVGQPRRRGKSSVGRSP